MKYEIMLERQEGQEITVICYEAKPGKMYKLRSHPSDQTGEALLESAKKLLLERFPLAKSLDIRMEEE